MSAGMAAGAESGRAVATKSVLRRDGTGRHLERLDHVPQDRLELREPRAGDDGVEPEQIAIDADRVVHHALDAARAGARVADERSLAGPAVEQLRREVLRVRLLLLQALDLDLRVGRDLVRRQRLAEAQP